MDYAMADSRLTGRCSLRRKVGNNTWLVRNSSIPLDTIHLKLHNTNILTWYYDGMVRLNSGGWKTVTTKARMNEYLPYGWRVFQQNYVWGLYRHEHPYVNFEDNMILNADTVIDPQLVGVTNG